MDWSAQDSETLRINSLSKRNILGEETPDFKRQKVEGNPAVVYIETGETLYFSMRKILERHPEFIALCHSTNEDSINLVSFDSKLVFKVLMYMHGLNIVISDDNVLELERLAMHLKMAGLQQELVKFKQADTPSKSIRTTAFLEGDSQGCDATLWFVHQNFSNILGGPEFSYLEENAIVRMVNTTHKELCAMPRFYEAVLRWVNHDFDRRGHLFEELFSLLDLFRFPLEYLEENVETEGLVRKSAVCSEKLHQAFRESYEKSEGLFFFDGSPHATMYHPQNERAFNIELRPNKIHKIAKKWGCSALSLKEKLYLFLHDQSVYCLNLSDNDLHWKRRKPMLYYHDAKPPVVALHGKIYAMGGGRMTIEMCERFDPDENRWTRLGPMTGKTMWYGVTAARARIYAVGINVQDRAYFSAEKCDPHDFSWEALPPLKEAICNPSVLTLDENVYVIGSMRQASSYTNVVSVWDTLTESWTMIVNSVNRFSLSEAYVVNNKIYAHTLLKQSPKRFYILQDGKWLPDACKQSCCISNYTSIWASCGKMQNFDFIVKVDNKEFPAHRSVLMKKSDYFKAMLSHETKEDREGIVVMKEVSAHAVRRLIDNMYGKELPDTNRENLQDFLQAAGLMQLHDAFSKICTFYNKYICIETFAELKFLANYYNRNDLEKICDDFATREFASITESDFFLEMEKEYVIFLISSLRSQTEKEKSHQRSDKLASQELVIYKAMIRWVNGNPYVRSNDFEELFSLLDLFKLSESFIDNVVKNEDLVKTSRNCKRIIDDTIIKRHELKDVFFFVDLVNANLRLMAYSSEMKKWTVLANGRIGYECNGFAVCANEALFVFYFPHFLYKCDYRRRTSWIKLKSASREYIGSNAEMAITNEHIYIMDDESIERYKIKDDNWSVFDSTIERTEYSSVGVHENVYVIGGRNAETEEPSASVDVLGHPDCQVTTSLASMYIARIHPSAVHFGGKIYVMGGTDYSERELCSTECYDPDIDAWSLLRDMHIAGSNIVSCVSGGRICVFGGSSFRAMEYYDINTKLWNIEVLDDCEEALLGDDVQICVAAGRIPYEQLLK